MENKILTANGIEIFSYPNRHTHSFCLSRFFKKCLTALQIIADEKILFYCIFIHFSRIKFHQKIPEIQFSA